MQQPFGGDSILGDFCAESQSPLFGPTLKIQPSDNFVQDEVRCVCGVGLVRMSVSSDSILGDFVVSRAISLFGSTR